MPDIQILDEMICPNVKLAVEGLCLSLCQYWPFKHCQAKNPDEPKDRGA